MKPQQTVLMNGGAKDSTTSAQVAPTEMEFVHKW